MSTDIDLTPKARDLKPKLNRWIGFGRLKAKKARERLIASEDIVQLGRARLCNSTCGDDHCSITYVWNVQLGLKKLDPDQYPIDQFPDLVRKLGQLEELFVRASSLENQNRVESEMYWLVRDKVEEISNYPENVEARSLAEAKKAKAERLEQKRCTERQEDFDSKLQEITGKPANKVK